MTTNTTPAGDRFLDVQIIPPATRRRSNNQRRKPEPPSSLGAWIMLVTAILTTLTVYLLTK